MKSYRMAEHGCLMLTSHIHEHLPCEDAPRHNPPTAFPKVHHVGELYLRGLTESSLLPSANRG